MTNEQVSSLRSEKQAIRTENMRKQQLVADMLRLECGQQWSDAWLALVVTRGNRFGLVKKTKPSHKQDRTGAQGLLWETWNDLLCDMRAQRMGFPFANRSLGGLIMASMSCTVDNADKASKALPIILKDVIK